MSLIWIERVYANKLVALRGPGERYSDVIFAHREPGRNAIASAALIHSLSSLSPSVGVVMIAPVLAPL